MKALAGTALAAVILYAALGTAHADDDNRQLWAAAQQCSDAALSRYAISSNEAAEQVARAAFQKCLEVWRIPAEIDGKKHDGPTRLGGLPYSVYLLRAAERHFVANAAPKVFDIRADGQPKANAEAKNRTRANREFNAIQAKEQTQRIEEADRANEAVGKALQKNSMATTEEISALMAKARQANKAVKDGWERIDQVRAAQAEQARRAKLLDDMQK